MLDWRAKHPYVAVHALRLARPLDVASLTSAIDDVLRRAGLTGLELDRTHARYAWRGGEPATKLDVVDASTDWHGTLAAAFERQLNTPFPQDGRIDPFRFFAVDAGDHCFVGLAYDHFIAGGDSIIVMLNAIADRYAGLPAMARPLALYPRTHWRLFARHPWAFVRGLRRLPALAQSCRHTVRPRFRAEDDGHNAFTFFTLAPVEFAQLRRASKDWGVTLNDVLIALLLLAIDAQTPPRDPAQRRHELAVASIMNLRDAHGDDAHRTFGQYLSSFRVSHPVPPGIALRDLAADVHHATATIKRERLFLTTLFAMSVNRAIGRFQTPGQRLEAYAKNYPVGAGVSSLNVNALWRAADGSSAPFYVRGVPTGPLSPIVVAVTTSGDTLCAGISYRTAAVSRETVGKMQSDIVNRIRALT